MPLSVGLRENILHRLQTEPGSRVKLREDPDPIFVDTEDIRPETDRTDQS